MIFWLIRDAKWDAVKTRLSFFTDRLDFHRDISEGDQLAYFAKADRSLPSQTIDMAINPLLGVHTSSAKRAQTCGIDYPRCLIDIDRLRSTTQNLF